jgi:peptide/nickel transport system permease protein
MSDDEPRADGGTASGTFESVEWSDIDRDETERTRTQVAWYAVAGLWSLLVLVDLYSRLIAKDGAFEFPLLGTIAPVTFLWSMTLLVLIFYGVAPLYKNKRMAAYYWTQFRKNKAAVISSLFILVVFLIGVVGSRVIPAPMPTPGIESQPPVYLSTPSYVTGVDCVGGTVMRSSGGQMLEYCQGSWAHPLGTTGAGEDILRGVVHGMEVSMQVGLIATLISITLATAVGLTAAYYGGLVDEVLMRYVDLQQTFPTLFLFLLLAYTIGGTLFLLIMIFGLFGWGNSARIIRGEALQRRAEPYVKASKSAGASAFWTIRRHLLPNVSNSIITAATLTIPVIILAEATFSFIGLADPTIPSWGRIISQGRGQLGDAWWISTVPGVFLFFTILAFNFLGDALRDALDPRHGGEGE